MKCMFSLFIPFSETIVMLDDTWPRLVGLNSICYLTSVLLIACVNHWSMASISL